MNTFTMNDTIMKYSNLATMIIIIGRTVCKCFYEKKPKPKTNGI